MGKRGRRRARDAKYSIEQVIRDTRSREESERIADAIAEAFRADLVHIRQRLFGSRIIEGTAVEVETRQDRLLDAGGSEP